MQAAVFENLEQELISNDQLENPFAPAQLRGLMADLERARQQCAEHPEGFLSEALRIYATWSARAARKYASDHINELRAENALLWQTVRSLQQRLGSIEQLISSSGSRH